MRQTLKMFALSAFFSVVILHSIPVVAAINNSNAPINSSSYSNPNSPMNPSNINNPTYPLNPVNANRPTAAPNFSSSSSYSPMSSSGSMSSGGSYSTYSYKLYPDYYTNPNKELPNTYGVPSSASTIYDRYDPSNRR